jgi:hypothetical protein
MLGNQIEHAVSSGVVGNRVLKATPASARHGLHPTPLPQLLRRHAISSPNHPATEPLTSILPDRYDNYGSSRSSGRKP